MRKLMTLTAAIVTATAIASSARAESEIGCDLGLSASAVQSNICVGLNRGVFTPMYAFAQAPIGHPTRAVARSNTRVGKR
jgi:hypothetical protein